MTMWKCEDVDVREFGRVKSFLHDNKPAKRRKITNDDGDDEKPEVDAVDVKLRTYVYSTKKA